MSSFLGKRTGELHADHFGDQHVDRLAQQPPRPRFRRLPAQDSQAVDHCGAAVGAHDESGKSTPSRSQTVFARYSRLT